MNVWRLTDGQQRGIAAPLPLSGCSCVRLLWCPAALVSGCSGVRLLWCPAALVSGCSGVRLLWCPVALVSGCSGVRLLWCPVALAAASICRPSAATFDLNEALRGDLFSKHAMLFGAITENGKAASVLPDRDPLRYQCRGTHESQARHPQPSTPNPIFHDPCPNHPRPKAITPTPF